jgi:ferrous iron transport protein B
MRRELGTWKATGAAVLYQCLLAYAVSMVIFQIGSLLMYGTFGIWTVAAFATVALAAYILVSKEPFARARQKISEAAA